MKRLIKSALKPFWRLTTPIRRPLARRVDARLTHLVAFAVEARLMPPLRQMIESSNRSMERLEGSILATRRSAEVLAEDVDVALEGISRELIRLQGQVELLQRTVEATGLRVRNGLVVVGDPDAFDEADADRAKVG